MARQSRRPPARKQDGGVDRCGTKGQQKAPDELPVGSVEQVAAEKRRTKVAEFMGSGLTQSEIAERLSVTQTTICNDMTQIRLEWRALRLADFDAAKDEVHGWALHNYRRAHKLLEKAEGTSDFALARLCLQEARKCQAEYAKLLGMYPATNRQVDLEEALQRLAARLSVAPDQLVM